MAPCKTYTGGLMLHQQFKFMPKEQLSCFVASHPRLKFELDPDYAGIPYQQMHKPKEQKERLFPGKIGALYSCFREQYTANSIVPRIAAKAVAFARQVNCEKIWCVLEGQTMIRIADILQRQLNIPMITQVWDPPEWWMKANKVDGYSVRQILDIFARVLERSEACAAASWAMAEYYRNEFDCNAIPLVPGLDKTIAREPATRINDRPDLIIGFAGQMYSVEEIARLVETVEALGWELGGRKVRIRVLGGGFDMGANRPRNYEYLGFRSQPETIELLADCDILYCPYWFDPRFEKESKQSFPSKLTTYLAAGRPVLFHGPDYSSPGRFLELNDAAQLCNSLERTAVLNALERLVWDQDRYRELADNGRRAFDTHLTTDVMRLQFCKVLGIEP